MRGVPDRMHLLRADAVPDRRTDRDGFEVMVDVGTGAPTLVHWGPPLGADGVHRFDALELAVPHGGPAVVAPVSTLPEHGSGSSARPGLLGRRGGGRDWAPRFVHDAAEVGPSWIVSQAVDPVARLRLITRIEVGHVLSVRHELVNEGDRRYSLDGLTVTLPIPEHLGELLVPGGRWTDEFRTERVAWPLGSWTVENRRGRTSHDAPPIIAAVTPGAGEWSGEVRLAHLAWSGNHAALAQRLVDGRRLVQLGELLHPGEVVLEPDERYSTPEVLAAWSSDGLTPASWHVHRYVRSLASHPDRPRPVLVNTWEGSYFDLDQDRLRRLADVAAAVGVERFVLDDGWFGGRRDDTRGLGDWTVSPEVFPDGLEPLIRHVRDRGMEFGIWVEPEMANPDSDLVRAHPDWLLTTEGYEPVPARHQVVLDLTRPDAFDHVHRALDALLRHHDIAFVKWDMNRDHVQASDAAGAAATHAQTLAVYRLVDQLREAHPHVEFESCASGGGRIDLGILARVQRVWTSDGNDALDRQRIQRGASLLLPPEVMGAHVGPRRSHTTGRVHSLAFRAATALFGHLGVELDLLELDERDRTRLAEVIALHRELRSLLHRGDAVRFDTEPEYVAHGVYAHDRSEAVVSWAVVDTPRATVPPPLRLPGLDPDRRYRVRHLPVPGERWAHAVAQPAWCTDPDGVVLTGRSLAASGIRPPLLHPASAVLFRLTVLDDHPA